MNPPLYISIVTPSFNQGEFLAETIESVIGQEGEFRIDYIIMDGGSTDDSVDIIRHYDELLKRGEWQVRCLGISYRWQSGKDNGQADALAKGFLMAEGDVLAWLNSDDTYLPGTLQEVCDDFRNYPDTGLLYGAAYYCDTSGANIGNYNTAEFDFERLAWFNFICQPSAFFRRGAFDKVGGIDVTLQFAMDYDLWIRIGQKYRCRYLPRFLSTYRLHEASKTIRDKTLFENGEEALLLARHYFGWAPLNRIYNSCSPWCRARLPAFLSRRPSVVVVAAVICTLLRSLWLNRGFSRRDLKQFNRDNFRKLFKSRIEIMTGAQGRK